MGVILVEVKLHFVVVGKFLYQAEDVENVIGISHYSRVFLEIEKAQVSVIILPGFLEQIFALGFIETKLIVFRTLTLITGVFVAFEKGREAFRLSPVGPAFDFQLHDPQIHTDLEFFGTILDRDTAGSEFIRIKRPVVKQITDILIHAPLPGK